MIGLAAAVAVAGTCAASTACSVPPDVLPVALPNAQAAAAIHTGGDAWVVTGTIYRCVDGGASSAEITLPPELGITRTAALHLVISGIVPVPESQLTQNKSTEWRVVSVPLVKVADPANADKSRNVLDVSWNASFVNVVSYQLSYTLYLTQAQ